MISFRARPPQGLEWDDISFAGENEDLLSHYLSTTLEEAGWEFLVSQDGGDFLPLDEIT